VSAERLFVALQRVLPQHALSRLTHALARTRTPWVRGALIRAFLRRYRINLDEAALSDPGAYASFNDFFTRALKPGVRPMPAEADAVVSPCDGTTSQIGTIDGSRLLQAELAAKRQTYTLSALCADEELARQFVGGAYCCLYLAPHDYHRVHMPLGGRLLGARYVPGRLFSVSAGTARHVSDLYARNERVVVAFTGAAGPMAVILVGALNVGSIGLAWSGEIPRGGVARALAVPQLTLERGQELGRFNLGSTVIVLFGARRVAWGPLAPGDTVRLGLRLGRVTAP
jgi:phosphatidylserine decarboxylase